MTAAVSVALTPSLRVRLGWAVTDTLTIRRPDDWHVEQR